MYRTVSELNLLLYLTAPVLWGCHGGNEGNGYSQTALYPNLNSRILCYFWFLFISYPVHKILAQKKYLYIKYEID